MGAVQVKAPLKAAKVPGAITVKNLKREVEKERWDNQTFKVVIRQGNGREIPVTGISNDRDKLVLQID